MRAITLKQPWAHAIFDLKQVADTAGVFGPKNIENRTWKTDYRGPLAIVAGLDFDPAGAAKTRIHADRLGVEYGCIVGVVDLVDVHDHLEGGCDPHGACKPVTSDGGWAEFRPSGLRTIFHWVLENPRLVPVGMSFPYTGFLGIRELTPGIAGALERATKKVGVEFK